jgi:riboflavin-specific deaminase-like protein
MLREQCSLAPPWEALFGALRQGNVDDLMIIGQMGQSLDGQVATANGHSHYINGAAGLTHLHQLRALVDAVVVGVGTANADDPQLTVRRIAGPNPARVVIDPGGRLSGRSRLLADDGVRRFVVMAAGRKGTFSGAEVIGIPASAEGRLSPPAILAALAERGMRRVLIEGGPTTVSRFLASGCIDRLHVVVSPIILGSGRPSFTLDPIDRVDQALRPAVHLHMLNGEVLFDCDLSAYRVPLWRAKKSKWPTVIEDTPAAT